MIYMPPHSLPPLVKGGQGDCEMMAAIAPSLRLILTGIHALPESLLLKSPFRVDIYKMFSFLGSKDMASALPISSVLVSLSHVSALSLLLNSPFSELTYIIPF